MTQVRSAQDRNLDIKEVRVVAVVFPPVSCIGPIGPRALFLRLAVVDGGSWIISIGGSKRRKIGLHLAAPYAAGPVGCGGGSWVMVTLLTVSGRFESPRVVGPMIPERP